MKRFRYWRKMTWAIVIAGGVLLVWVATGGFALPGMAASLAVLGVLWVLWYLSQPLMRQGRGLQLRRWQQTVPVPFKSPSSSASQDLS
jgi:hypothetical protein